MNENAEIERNQPVVRTKLAADQLQSFFEGIACRHRLNQITFVCIGTDRSTGDALGPLTGSRLMEYGFPRVIGTLPEPCDAHNLEERLTEIEEGSVVIAIDACLGQPSSLGFYYGAAAPLQPAQSIGKLLPGVGDYSLAAVVNVNGPKPYWTLQVTSLYTVITMAEQIAGSAAAAFGLRT